MMSESDPVDAALDVWFPCAWATIRAAETVDWVEVQRARMRRVLDTHDAAKRAVELSACYTVSACEAAKEGRDKLIADYANRHAESHFVVREEPNPLTARVERLEAALRAMERHVSLHAMDKLIRDADDGKIIGWGKTARLMKLTDEARAALGDAT